MRQADVAIRLRQPVQPDLIQRRLFTVHMHLYAAPAYLERFGQPKSIDDLDEHRIVTFGVPVPAYLRDLNWLETRRPRRRTTRASRCSRSTTSSRSRTRSAAASASPCCRTTWSSRESGLVRLLPEEQVPSFATYFVYPAELKNSARVHVFRDFLLSQGAELVLLSCSQRGSCC